jgi:glyoxylase-like metal-dependent hydrolase (beta-lactamase superfamily II)
MFINLFKDSKLEENTYLVEFKNKYYLIDPGYSFKSVIKYLEKSNIVLSAVLITHGHFDHYVGTESIIKQFACPVYINTVDVPLYSGKVKLFPFCPVIDFPVKDIIYDLNIEGLEILSTPGHSAGSVCLYFKEENVLFSGDTLFFHGYGRYDLYSGNKKIIENSLYSLFKLPENTVVYPGHGAKTTILEEKEYTNKCGL